MGCPRVKTSSAEARRADDEFHLLLYSDMTFCQATRGSKDVVLDHRHGHNRSQRGWCFRSATGAETSLPAIWFRVNFC